MSIIRYDEVERLRQDCDEINENTNDWNLNNLLSKSKNQSSFKVYSEDKNKIIFKEDLKIIIPEKKIINEKIKIIKKVGIKESIISFFLHMGVTSLKDFIALFFIVNFLIASFLVLIFLYKFFDDMFTWLFSYWICSLFILVMFSDSNK